MTVKTYLILWNFSWKKSWSTSNLNILNYFCNNYSIPVPALLTLDPNTYVATDILHFLKIMSYLASRRSKSTVSTTRNPCPLKYKDPPSLRIPQPSDGEATLPPCTRFHTEVLYFQLEICSFMKVFKGKRGYDYLTTAKL